MLHFVFSLPKKSPMQTRQSYLKAMGIEVWTYRDPGPLAVSEVISAPGAQSSADRQGINAAAAVLQQAASVRGAGQTKEETQTASMPDPQPGSPEPVPEFRLGLLRYEGLGIVVSLERQAELPRRLCDDIARMFLGQDEVPGYQLLEWPMLDNSSIDQSLSAARQVVTQKFSQLPARVLVLGEEVGTYFGPLAALSEGEPVSMGRQSFLLVSNLSALKSSADSKRQLMHCLQQWQQA